MMTICPKCGQHYDVDQDYVGCTVDCEICGSQFEVKQSPCVPMSADISPQIQEQTIMSEIPAQSFDAAQMHGGTAPMSSPPHRSSMKPLVCEMCGSSDLMKTDGVFVCQSCGTKYSVEEAKKMMIAGTVKVAGTVKIDKSEELENLYKLARRARETNDFSQAAKYYDLILQKGDPNSWEAYFYSDYCRIQQVVDSEEGDSTWDKIGKYKNKLTTVIGLVANIGDLNSRRRVYDEISLNIRNLVLGLKDTTINRYVGDSRKGKLQSLVDLCYSLGNILRERYERGDKAIQVTTFTDCWITGVMIHNEFPSRKERLRMIDMIQRYRKDYVAPESYELKRVKQTVAHIIIGIICIFLCIFLFVLLVWALFAFLHWIPTTLITLYVAGGLLNWYFSE